MKTGYLPAAQHPSFKHRISLGHVNADVHHLVVDPLEPGPHLLNGNDEAHEESLQQLAHCLVSLLMHAFYHHDHGLVHQLVVEVRNFQILEASRKERELANTLIDNY